MSLATNLLRIAQLADAASEMLPLLEQVRNAYTDNEWEALEEAHPALCALVGACADIEAAVEALD
jgi:hypothetical protein